MELQCSVQNYDWGKLGSSSEVAKLAAVCSKSLQIDETKPYAELWMGTHVNGPCSIKENDMLLSSWLPNNLDSLGVDARNTFGDDLPFLFKVLSVRKALSIQAHPNKKHAEELHKSHPHLYKDPNHKPELAIALTPFQALCGFRAISEIQKFVKDLPELQNVLGSNAVNEILNDANDPSVLKTAFNALMTQDDAVMKENLETLVKRLSNSDVALQNKLLFPLLDTLYKEFSGDVGCWCIYFLNYITMSPGEAIFLGPNVPHAYLYGDCIECMACSDNVVRAGLTPKYIDVVTLIGMLEYESRSPTEVLFQPGIEDDFTKVWRPPVKDFAVAQIKIPKNKTTPYNSIIRHSASILLVISGKATIKDNEDKCVSRGSVVFLKASRQLTIVQCENTDEDLIIYQAMCNM